MGWADVIATAAGGAEGWQRGKDQDREREMVNAKLLSAQDLAQLKADVAEKLQGLKDDRTDQRLNVLEGGRNTRAEAGNTTRTNIAAAGNASREGIAANSLSEQNRQHDLTDSQYWDKAARDWSLGLGRDATTRRGQDLGASTTMRGQDMSAATTTRGQDLAAEGRATSADLNAYTKEMNARKASAGPYAAPSEPLPTIEEWLKTRGATPANGADVELPQAGAPAGAPLPAPRGLPVPARPVPTAAAPLRAPRTPGVAPNAAPAAGAPKIPAGLKPGVIVRTKDGKRVKVTAVHPDGTFESQPVQ